MTNTKKITISARIHVAIEDIKNLLDSGSRGIHYWGESDLGFDSETKKAFDQGVIVSDYEGATEKDQDGEWKPITYVLDLKKIKRGLTVMAKKEPHAFADFISNDYDMYTGDTFIQCCIFGEVIYS